MEVYDGDIIQIAEHPQTNRRFWRRLATVMRHEPADNDIVVMLLTPEVGTRVCMALTDESDRYRMLSDDERRRMESVILEG